MTKSLLHNLEIDSSFLDSDPEPWVNTEAYVRGKVRISMQMMTNDAAQRSVALIRSFTTTAEDQLQAMVQVVEEQRRGYPKATNERHLLH